MYIVYKKFFIQLEKITVIYIQFHLEVKKYELHHHYNKKAKGDFQLKRFFLEFSISLGYFFDFQLKWWFSHRLNAFVHRRRHHRWAAAVVWWPSPL